MIAEIRDYLPAFLGSQSTERADPVGDIQNLLNLQASDLDRITAAHVTLSDDVRLFIQNLKLGLRRPVVSTRREPEVSDVVRGPIDWGATVRARAGKGGVGTLFVVRPAQRVFDTPENRALAYVVDRLTAETAKVVGTSPDEISGTSSGWLAEIAGMHSELRGARRHYWLRDIRAEKPNGQANKQLAANRSRFFSENIPRVLAVLRDYSDDPTPEALTDLLSRRYFEPERDWQLFEVLISLRVARALTKVLGPSKKDRLLLGVGRQPFARFQLDADAEILLWYQTWPPTASSVILRQTQEKYGIASGGTRPDLVIELRRSGKEPDGVLLELKATRNASYLASGLGQLLAYLTDRPAVFESWPSGWLVAPRSPAFKSVSPDGLQLWAVAAEDVGEAVVQRFVTA